MLLYVMDYDIDSKFFTDLLDSMPLVLDSLPYQYTGYQANNSLQRKGCKK